MIFLYVTYYIIEECWLLSCGELICKNIADLKNCLPSLNFQYLDLPPLNFQYLNLPLLSFQYLNLPLLNFQYLSLPLLNFQYLNLPLLNFQYLNLPLLNFQYLSIIPIIAFGILRFDNVRWCQENKPDRWYNKYRAVLMPR